MSTVVLDHVRRQLPTPTADDELAELVPARLGWEDWVQAGVVAAVAIVAAIAVRFWHDSSRRSMWATRSDVIAAVKSGLDEAGIEIPFPQRVLQIGGHGASSLNAE